MDDDTPAPDTACIDAIHAAICDLASNAIIPMGLEWVGVFVHYDIEGDRLTSTIMHGGTGPGGLRLRGDDESGAIPDLLRRGSGLTVSRTDACGCDPGLPLVAEPVFSG